MNITGIANIENSSKWLMVKKLKQRIINRMKNRHSMSESLEYVKENMGHNSLVLQMEMIQNIIV